MRHELADGSDCFKDVSYTYYANGWLATIFEQFTARGGGDRGSVHGVETQEDWVCGPVHEGGR